MERNINLAINTHLTKPVKIFKVCLVKSVPHYLNIHVIQILEIEKWV